MNFWVVCTIFGPKITLKAFSSLLGWFFGLYNRFQRLAPSVGCFLVRWTFFRSFVDLFIPKWAYCFLNWGFLAKRRFWCPLLSFSCQISFSVPSVKFLHKTIFLAPSIDIFSSNELFSALCRVFWSIELCMPSVGTFLGNLHCLVPYIKAGKRPLELNFWVKRIFECLLSDFFAPSTGTFYPK